MYKFLLLLLFPSIMFVDYNKEININDFLILSDNSSYYYTSIISAPSFNGEERTSKIHSKIEQKSLTIEGEKVYYYLDIFRKDNSVSNNYFIEYPFYIKNDSIYISEVSTLNELEKLRLKDFIPYMPIKMSIGKRCKFETYSESVSISFSTLTNYKTDNFGILDTCYMMMKSTHYKDFNKTVNDYAYFNKKLGMIMWQRRTGRVDNLTEVKLKD